MVPLRELLILAAQHYVKLIPRWISSQHNRLAEGLSRLDLEATTDLTG